MAKRVRGSGRVWKRKGGGWAISYYVDGTEHRESASVALNKPAALVTEREANALLIERLASVGRGVPTSADAARFTVGDAIDGWLENLRLKHAKSMGPATYRAKVLREHFGHVRIPHLTLALVSRYTKTRLADGMKEGTVHGELTCLTAALNLARKQQRIPVVPFIPKPPASRPRQGFLEPEAFARILGRVTSSDYRDAVEFAYVSGWRSGEIKGLLWSQVFRREGEIRLPDGKNGDPAIVPLTMRDADGRVVLNPLGVIIERRWLDRNLASPLVFHYRGKPLGDRLLDCFKEACVAAGEPVRYIHDMRRSAVRNLVRAGVDKTVAKKITRHRSDTVFTAYNITSIEDQERAFAVAERYRSERVMSDKTRTIPLEA